MNLGDIYFAFFVIKIRFISQFFSQENCIHSTDIYKEDTVEQHAFYT